MYYESHVYLNELSKFLVDVENLTNYSINQISTQKINIIEEQKFGSSKQKLMGRLGGAALDSKNSRFWGFINNDQMIGKEVAVF